MRRGGPSPVWLAVYVATGMGFWLLISFTAPMSLTDPRTWALVAGLFTVYGFVTWWLVKRR